MSGEESVMERSAKLTQKGKEVLQNVELGIKENRVKVCKECIKDAAKKNEEAKKSPAPLNWNSEWWLCCRLRENGQCPLDLPSLNPILSISCSRDTVY